MPSDTVEVTREHRHEAACVVYGADADVHDCVPRSVWRWVAGEIDEPLALYAVLLARCAQAIADAEQRGRDSELRRVIAYACGTAEHQSLETLIHDLGRGDHHRVIG